MAGAGGLRAAARRIRGAAGPVAALAAGLLVGFWGLVAQPDALIVDGDRPWVDAGDRPVLRPIGNDLTGLILPRFLWQRDRWRADGSIPRWDDRGFAGRPNAGNPQAGLWYPPIWAAWSWGDPAAPGWLTVAHLLWAGLGAFALARAIGLGRSAATASGAVLMLNPYVIAQVHEGHLPHVWSASWYPWAFLGAIALRRGRPIGWLLLPPSLALSLMTGHPQEGVYLVLAMGAWAAVDAAIAARARRSGRGAAARPGEARGPARWAVAMALAAGLSAVEWGPYLAARPWLAGPLGGEGLGGSGPHHLRPANLWQLVSPRALGGPADVIGGGNHWETLLSVGWAPLVLVVLGASAFPERRSALGWAALLGMSLWVASGPSLGLAALVEALPGMGAVRVPARTLFLAATAAAVLAGMGVEVIASRADRARAARWARRYALAVALIALAVASGLAAGRIAGGDRADRPAEALGRWSSASDRIARDGLSLAAIAATGAALAWRSRTTGGGSGPARAVALAALAELSGSAASALPISPPARFLAPDAVSEALARAGTAEGSRVRARDAFYSDLDAWRDGVEKTNLGDLFQVRHAAEVVRELYPLFDDPGSRSGRRLDPGRAQAALDRLGVARIVSDRPTRMEVGPERASGVRRGVPFAVVANRGALPRARVVPRAEVVDPSRALDRLAEADPRRVVLLPVDPMPGIAGPRQPFTPAEIRRRGPDRLVIRATTAAPGLLVVADAWMPGWSATVDGRPAPVLRGDHAFRVVPLPEPGAIEVVMTYRAPGLGLGASTTLATGLAWLGIVLGRVTTPPRRGRPASG